LHTDIVVLGGGVSGLWLLNAFKQQGYRCLLLEKNSLGGEQTFASQGMIHGGIKYALGGFTTPASESIANMPETWRNCLAGKGTLHLKSVKTLSSEYFLFSDGSLSSKVTSFFGSRAIRSRVSSLPREQFQAPFSDPQFKGWIYRLQDLVIDTGSLVSELQMLANGQTFRSDSTLVCNNDNQVDHLVLGSGQRLKAELYVFAAGAGNASLLEKAGIDSIQMQRRPLHQVMLTAEDLPPVYAHAVSLKSADKPKVTITTHQTKSGAPVWYLGGNLAETGVDRSEGEQIDFARKEINSLFPWMDMGKAKWATYRIDRAEPAQAERNRPDQPFFKMHNNILVCWPTKLTLVPMMADAICATLSLPESGNQEILMPDLPTAEIAPAPWETCFD
jgi:glycerol-3-phosphate dehydrogenase